MSFVDLVPPKNIVTPQKAAVEERKRLRQQLAQDVDAFLAAGGKIQTFDDGKIIYQERRGDHSSLFLSTERDKR